MSDPLDLDLVSIVHQCSSISCIQQCLVQAMGEMGDLSDFQNGQIMSLAVHLYGVLRTAFMIMTACTKHGKTSLEKKKSEQKPKVSD